MAQKPQPDESLGDLPPEEAKKQPTAVLAWGEPYPSQLWEGRTTPQTAGKAFVCRNYTCGAPVEDVDSLLEELAAAGPSITAPSEKVT